jgi:hypothetical protein
MFTEVSNGDDWVALYDGDELVAQGREISYKDILDHLNKKYKEGYSEYADTAGMFPDNLSEIKDFKGY